MSYYTGKGAIINLTICTVYELPIYNSFTEVVTNMTSLRKIIYLSNHSICYNITQFIRIISISMKK